MNDGFSSCKTTMTNILFDPATLGVGSFLKYVPTQTFEAEFNIASNIRHGRSRKGLKQLRTRVQFNVQFTAHIFVKINVGEIQLVVRADRDGRDVHQSIQFRGIADELAGI